MKLQDPIAPFAGVIARRRRQRAAVDADCFRFGGVLLTDEQALDRLQWWARAAGRSDQIGSITTLAYIGALGGLLADLGNDVYAVSSLPDLDARPAFVGWVGGEETAAEHERLAALDAPGLSVGPRLDGVETWSSLEPEGQPTSIEFIRTALDEIRRLTEGDGAPVDEASGDASTAASTVRGGTGTHGMVRPGCGQPRSPSSRARSGTERDRTKRRSEGS